MVVGRREVVVVGFNNNFSRERRDVATMTFGRLVRLVISSHHLGGGA